MHRSFDWAIGLFEGEGTILIRKRPEDQIALSLSSTDEDVVRQFCSVVNFGKVYGPYQYGARRKPFWKWNADKGTEVEAFLRRSVPLLGIRRTEKAREAIQRWGIRQSRPHYTVSRKGMGGRPTHKVNGAEYTKERL